MEDPPGRGAGRDRVWRVGTVLKWSQYDYDLEELRVCERALREVTDPGRQVAPPQTGDASPNPGAGREYREQLHAEIERLRARLELDD